MVGVELSEGPGMDWCGGVKIPQYLEDEKLTYLKLGTFRTEYVFDPNKFIATA